jgi:hypothetical protein
MRRSGRSLRHSANDAAGARQELGRDDRRPDARSCLGVRPRMEVRKAAVVYSVRGQLGRSGSVGRARSRSGDYVELSPSITTLMPLSGVVCPGRSERRRRSVLSAVQRPRVAHPGPHRGRSSKLVEYALDLVQARTTRLLRTDAINGHACSVVENLHEPRIGCWDARLSFAASSRVVSNSSTADSTSVVSSSAWSDCGHDQTDDKANAEGAYKAGNPRPP